ncbi:uncharacterized protein LOC111884761 [Lactuca sativa]|uniref:uncharacterized protein LOC111884761 n=1 Tax=Lactuca sativa TaxID=4236 RepID=UPI000CD7ED55|nr:uncharacterized protein LOC111884761 [Lactuca sativa]
MTVVIALVYAISVVLYFGLSKEFFDILELITHVILIVVDRVDEEINKSHAPYVFKVSGQISHWIGSLYPQDGGPPRFLQLYMCDIENEVVNRIRAFREDNNVVLSADIVACLSDMLTANNEYVRTFKTAKEISQSMSLDSYAVRLFNTIPDRRYGPPVAGTLGCIVCGDDVGGASYDVVIYSKTGLPQRISKLHPSYMPLMYPLLFPYGEAGWSPQLQIHNQSSGQDKNLTNNMFYSYQIHDRLGVYSLLLRGRRLFQQYLVDAYTFIEQSRLDYIEHHQQQLRSEYVTDIYDALSRGDTDTPVIGRCVFLPASFVGGPRYMYKHYQDALAICRVHGKPQYFITFTCNVKWPEYRRYTSTIGQGNIQDRPDIIARVFRIKVDALVDFLKEDKTFGDVDAQFQKRRLPHCHLLHWVASPFKIYEPADVDKYITAELPDPTTEVALYRTVTTCMLHGPCGLLNMGAPCMRDNKCSKRFPKAFMSSTTFDDNGYVHYRRHVGNMMIKYLFKYVSKGVDRVQFVLQRSESTVEIASSSNLPFVNEINTFLDGRYICPHEAAWRILNFPIHECDPAVQVLAIHLDGMQTTIFNGNTQLSLVVNNPTFAVTTLTEWMNNNRIDIRGVNLTYLDYPTKFRWNASSKRWSHRFKANSTSIGRLAYVHPTAGELFYLRILLCHQKGCISYDDIRTVHGITHSTFRAACEALGLTGDDREWLAAFTEASSWATASEMQSLFCHLLLFCDVGSPFLLWESAKSKMGDDIHRELTLESPTPELNLHDDIVEQQILLEIQKLLLASTPSRSLADFGLPLPSPSLLALNPDQIRIYEDIVNAEQNQKQLLLFVYGHGGTGKTYLWTTILSYFRSIGKIVLAVAASDRSCCNIKKNTQLAELLKKTSMIIWDEAPMSDWRCFESLDRSLKDVLENNKCHFGGMSMLLGGDFHQTLPVQPKNTN